VRCAREMPRQLGGANFVLGRPKLSRCALTSLSEISPQISEATFDKRGILTSTEKRTHDSRYVWEQAGIAVRELIIRARSLSSSHRLSPFPGMPSRFF
jgi:hypothetical protein